LATKANKYHIRNGIANRQRNNSMVLEPIARAFVAKKIRFKEGVARKLKSPLIIDP